MANHWEENPIGFSLKYRVGRNFTPYVMTVDGGQDVAGSILQFAHQEGRASVILSAVGSLSLVTLREFSHETSVFQPSAQRLQLASVYKGEAEKLLLVKKAEAEAEAEAKYLGGVGVARQRQAITDGLRENILNFSNRVEGTSAKEIMDLIMVTQYFDTIRDLGNSSKNTTVHTTWTRPCQGYRRPDSQRHDGSSQC